MPATTFPYDQNELYSWLLPQGAIGNSLGKHLDERHEMWNWLMKFPEYGPYWKGVAADQWFESPSRLVPLCMCMVSGIRRTSMAPPLPMPPWNGTTPKTT